MRCLDLHFLGRPGVIATGVIETPDGVLLVDPGPGSCAGRLRSALEAAGIRWTDVAALLLTHIHLDHAGVSGTLARECPSLRVFVHQRGAPHMAEPGKLLASATRLYGADMDRLWGEFAPVPAGQLHVLQGGEVLDFGGYRIDVAYTPGHASHHVTYLDRQTGVACTGDVAGIRIGAAPYVLPPTPPPDIDLSLWRGSLDRLAAAQPSGMFVTHFGLKTDVAAHLDLLRDELEAWGRVSRDLHDTGDASSSEARFTAGVAARIAERAGDAADAYRAAVPLEHCWMGLARYWGTRRGPAQER